MNKQEAANERKIIRQMTEAWDRLKQSERSELIRLKARHELLTFCVVVIPKAFKPYPVHRIVCDFVQQCADDDPDKEYLTVSLPPRAGKSTIISQYLPAWQLGRNPNSYHILASHTMDRTQGNVTKLLEIMTHPEYLKIFPEAQIYSKQVSTKNFRMKAGGEVLAASPQRRISGFDAGTMFHHDFPGLIILDDLLAKGYSPAELETAWNFTSVQLITRGLPNKGIISMGTRYHINDVTGRLIEASPEIWKTLNIPALCVDPENDILKRQLGESYWEEAFPVKDLKLIQSIQGDEEFSTIYQGSPPGSKGNYIKKDDLMFVDTLLDGYIFFSVDTNIKGKEMGDFNCVCVWKKVNKSPVIQLIDVFHQRCDFAALTIYLDKLIKFWKPFQVIIESGANGDSLMSVLALEYPGLNLIPYRPTRDKITRINLAAPQVKRGGVVIYQGIVNWEAYEKQLLQFPFVRHDDFVDAFAIGINYYLEVVKTGEFLNSHASLGYGMNSFFQEKAENGDVHKLQDNVLSPPSNLVNRNLSNAHSFF